MSLMFEFLFIYAIRYRCREQLRMYWLSNHGQPARGGPPAWGLGEGLKTPHRKNPACYEILHRHLTFAGSCGQGYEHSGSIKGEEFLD